MEKITANLSGVHDLKSAGSTGIRSIPLSSKSVFLELYMRQNKKDRIEKEKIRLQKRGKQIQENLTVINKGMAKLLKIATTGSKGLSKTGEAYSKSGSHTVLEF